MVARAAWSAVLDWCFPKKCSLCLMLGDESICPVCRGEFEDAPPPSHHLADSDALAWHGGLFRYTGRAAQAVKRLKFERATALAEPMSLEIAEGVAAIEVEFDTIVPVPIHWLRRMQRGFNQAELLCRRLDPDLVQPSWLRRIRATRPQVGLSTRERLRNLEGAFSADPAVLGQRILLIDDVVTSGGTAAECARTLRKAGADWVGILTFAAGDA